MYQQKEDLNNDLKNDTFLLNLATIFPPVNALGTYFIPKLQKCDTYWRATLNQGEHLFQSKKSFLFDF